MQQLLDQLGIDWHLLLSQAVNFFLLLVVLRLAVYKPLLAMLHERRRRIEEGVAKAAEADRRLGEAETMKLAKMKEGEVAAIALLKRTEGEAKALGEKMLAEAKRKEAEEMKAAEALIKTKEGESRRAMELETAAIVKTAIAKTVELAPEQIEDALIARAIEEAKRPA